MRSIPMYKPGRKVDGPPEEEAMGQLIGEMAEAGVLAGAEGLQLSSKGTRVRKSAKKFPLIDGPFAETKG